MSRVGPVVALFEVRHFPLLVALFASCTGQVGDLDPPDASALVVEDAGVDPDAGVTDAGPLDAGRVDAGPLDAGPLDAGPLDAGASDAGAPDSGTMLVRDAGRAFHVVVAAGWGGRRVRSCDDGLTWGANVQEADQAQDDWHRSYTPKALTFGAGKFVFLSGWGTASTAWVSSDATTWTPNALSTPYGGLGFSDGRFVLVGNRNIGGASAAATGWAVQSMSAAAMYDRAAAAFDGIWAAGSDGNVQVRRTGQAMWQAVTACVGTRHTSIGFTGGFAAGNGALLSVGDDGNVCVVDAQTGLHRGNASLGVAARGPVVFDGTRFLAATGARLVRSTDGLTWTTQMLPTGVRFELVSRSRTGRLIGVASNGMGAWFSDDDGASWTRAANFPAGNGLLYLASGELSTCP